MTRWLSAATALAAGLLALGPAPPAAARPWSADVADVPVDVLVTDLLPELPRPGDDVELRGRLIDRGDLPVTALRVRLRVGDRIDSRSGLAGADVEVPDAYVRTAEVEPKTPDLQPGAGTTFSFRVPVEQLGLTEQQANGVYPLQVEVRGLVGTEPSRSRVGFVPTYLPWFGARRVEPTRLAWLMPLADVPRLAPDGELLDEGLAASLAPGGRLAGLLAAGRAASRGSCLPEPQPSEGRKARPRPAERRRCEAVPVTYAVDPDLLVTAQTLAGPHRLLSDDPKAAARPGTAGAAGWLAGLRSAAATGDLLALPYGDPDLVALSRPRARLAADVANARRVGDEVVDGLIGTTPLAGVAWPPPGRLTADAVESAGSQAGGTIVLDGSAVGGPPVDVGRTPGTRAALASSDGTPRSGLVIDDGLARLLEPDPLTWHGARLAQQRFLAETAIIAAERPGEGRTLLVAPARRGTLDPAFAAATLRDTGRLPWLCPVPLADVVAGREHCLTPSAGRSLSSYGPDPGHGPLLAPDDRRAELDAPYLRRVAGVRDKVLQLTGSVLPAGTAETATTRARMLRGVFRAESSAWRDGRPGGAQLTDLLGSDVARYSARVRVITGSITLTSRSGSVSVDVENTLDQPVTLRVQLTASNEARLSTQETPLLEVPARTRIPVAVRAEAVTSGRFVVTAVLRDRDGNVFGQPAELQVRSTRYGTVTLAITGVAAGVLLLAAGVRLTRRALGHGRDLDPA